MKYFLSLTMLFVGLFYLYQKGSIFADFESVSAKQAFLMVQEKKENLIILDVRTQNEYKNDGYIEGAILIPLQVLESELSKLQPHKNSMILVYCNSGRRSVAASRILSKAGYKAVNIDGGIQAWSGNKYQVQKSDR